MRAAFIADSPGDKVNSIDQKLVILTKALEERGLKKEAFIVRHICRDSDSITKEAVAFLAAIPALGTWLAGLTGTTAITSTTAAVIGYGSIAAVVGAGLGIAHGYNSEDIDEELAARLNSKAEELVANMNKLGSWGGSDVEGGMVDFAVISGITEDPTKFRLLYREIARVLAGQDTEIDLHWGWLGGQDSGDFSAFANLEDRLVDRFAGKPMTMRELKTLLIEDPSEFLEWGEYGTWEYSKEEIQNYVDSWNSLYELELTMAEVLEQLIAESSDNEEATTTADEEATTPADESEEPDHTPVQPL
jgi:hypothetical protein